MHLLLLAAALTQAPVKTTWDGEARSIVDLGARATAILVGTGEVKRQVGVTAFVVLRRQRTLKGNLAGWVDDAKRFEVLWEAAWDPGPLSGTVHGLWFLEQDVQGHWFVLPPFRRPSQPQDIAVPLPRERPPRQEKGTPLIDAITDELWQATRSTDGEMADRASSVLLTILEDAPYLRTSPRQARYAHWAFLGPGHWVRCPTARLAREWEVLRLERAERYLREHPTATEMAWLKSWPPNLCRSHTAETLPLLTHLLDGRVGAEYQVCFAQAVAGLRTEEALAVLGRLFDRPEKELQGLAMSEVREHARQEARELERSGSTVAPVPSGRASVFVTGATWGRGWLLSDPVALARVWLSAHLIAGHPRPPIDLERARRVLGPEPAAQRAVQTARVRLWLGLPPEDPLSYWPTHWPAPVACRVDTQGPLMGSWATARFSACDPRDDHGLEVEIERHLCPGCRAPVFLTLQDAWGERTSTVLYAVEPPPPSSPPGFDPWLMPPRPTPRPGFNPWLVEPSPTPTPGSSPWLEPPK